MSPLHSITHWFRRPLSCRDVNQFIVDYLEGTIPAAMRTRFETHIANCPRCGPYFDQYIQTIHLAREEGSERMDLPEALVEATLAFLRQHYDHQEAR